MSKLTVITDRAFERVLDLASQASHGIRHASQSFQQRHPQAGAVVQSSAALGALRQGRRVLQTFAKRNPALAIVTATVGLGVIGYAVYRKRKQMQASLLEGVIEHPVEEYPSRLSYRRHQATRMSSPHRLIPSEDPDNRTP